MTKQNIRDQIVIALTIRWHTQNRHRRENKFLSYSELANKLNVNVKLIEEVCSEMGDVIEIDKLIGRVRLAHENTFLNS
jgi:ribosome-binding protein aMBF1 (putative translation factor)